MTRRVPGRDIRGVETSTVSLITKQIVPLATFCCRGCGDRWIIAWSGSDGLCPDCTSDGRDK